MGRYPTSEGDAGTSEPLQAARVGTVADDDQGQAQRVEGLDRHLDALVRHELGDEHVVLPDRARCKARGLDGRVDHGRLASEVGPDPSLRGD